MILVLDTNVLLAGLGTKGLCHELLTICLGQHHVVLSESILCEFTRHFSGKFGVSDASLAAAVALLRNEATFAAPAEVDAPALEDADDLPVLGTAVAARADALITGDRHLLALSHIEHIPILCGLALYAAAESA